MYSFIDKLQEVCSVISERQQQNTIRAFYIDKLSAGIIGYYAIIFKLASDNKLELCYKIKDEKEFNIFINCLDKPDDIYYKNVCGYVNNIPFILLN